MRKTFLVLLLSACGDDGGGADPTVHLVQEGDSEVFVLASLGRGNGAESTISVQVSRGLIPVTDATVQAGPLGVERAIAFAAPEESYVGSWTGEHALVHVHAAWSTGSADMVVAMPAPITLVPDPIATNAEVTVHWQPWQADSDGFVNITAGIANSTLVYSAIETDLTKTSHVVPSNYLPGPGSYVFEAYFSGDFHPTGGVGGDQTPMFQLVQYGHLVDRTIP